MTTTVGQMPKKQLFINTKMNQSPKDIHKEDAVLGK